MSKELTLTELADMASVDLARYIEERLLLNNYAEARRATSAMLIRLSPVPSHGTVSERIADAIVAAHLAGQSVGEQRCEKELLTGEFYVLGFDPRLCLMTSAHTFISKAAAQKYAATCAPEFKAFVAGRLA